MRLFFCCLLIIALSMPRCVGQGRDIETFLRDASLGVEAHPVKWQALVDWRLRQEKELFQLLASHPKMLGNELCRQISTAPGIAAFNLTLCSSKYFLHSQRAVLVEAWSAEDKVIEQLRRVQVERFLRDAEFRRRYMQICIWETGALRHHLTNQHFVSNPVLQCNDLENSADRFEELVRSGAPAIKEVPSTVNMQLLFFMTVTSREDLFSNGKDTNVIDMYREWHNWFKANKSRLVQRHDLLGWTESSLNEARPSNSPGAWIRFPLLAIPESPIADIPSGYPELRRSFGYELR